VSLKNLRGSKMEEPIEIESIESMISGYPPKLERIRIRCDRETYVEFKKIAAEFKTQEEALKALISLYKRVRSAVPSQY